MSKKSYNCCNKQLQVRPTVIRLVDTSGESYLPVPKMVSSRRADAFYDGWPLSVLVEINHINQVSYSGWLKRSTFLWHHDQTSIRGAQIVYIHPRHGRLPKLNSNNPRHQEITGQKRKKQGKVSALLVLSLQEETGVLELFCLCLGLTQGVQTDTSNDQNSRAAKGQLGVDL